MSINNVLLEKIKRLEDELEFVRRYAPKFDEFLMDREVKVFDKQGYELDHLCFKDDRESRRWFVRGDGFQHLCDSNGGMFQWDEVGFIVIGDAR